ncbi:MAG TPA: carboxymuconolactone decarboxylase family protein [Steroidobacteraceae bacterium]|nr:carboxymuconolactone decarboxylase family protein [Steroidobacteraceae bacterium]
MSQTLLTRIPGDQLAPQWRPAWETLRDLTGSATFVEVFAQAPQVLDFVMNKFYIPLFFGGQVQQRYKQLARLKLSLLHGCQTCNKQNIPGARGAGFTQEQIDALIAADHAPFTDAERAVLAYAEQVALTNVSGALSSALYRELREHFSEADILELGTVMAVISGMAKLSFVLDVVEKEDYCPFANGTQTSLVTDPLV